MELPVVSAIHSVKQAVCVCVCVCVCVYVVEEEIKYRNL